MQEIHSAVGREVRRSKPNCHLPGATRHLNESYLKGSFHSKPTGTPPTPLRRLFRNRLPHSFTQDSGLIVSTRRGCEFWLTARAGHII